MSWEINKWYEFNPNNLGKQIGKVSKLSTDYVHFDPWIINCGTLSGSSGCFNNIDNISELDVSEEIIQKHLPEGHPDKIPSIPEYVEFIGKGYTYFTLGKVYRVEETGYPNYDNGVKNFVLKYDNPVFKPSTKEAYEAQNKPKEVSLVGRYVKTVTNSPDGGFIKSGEIGKIETKVSETFIINFPSHDNYSVYSTSLKNPHKYELMPEDWKPDGIGLNFTEIKPDLLAQAKLKYPIGTKFRNPIKQHKNVIHTVTTCDPAWNSSRNGINITCLRGADGRGCLYYEGKWAEIIEEPKKDFRSTKIWIGDNPELSRKVQEKLFELGFRWFEDGVKYTQNKALYTAEDENLGYGDRRDFFTGDSRKEIFPSDLGIVDVPSVDMLTNIGDAYLKSVHNHNVSKRLMYTEPDQPIKPTFEELVATLWGKNNIVEEFFKPKVESMDFTIFTQQTPKQLGVISIKQIKI